MRETDNIKLEHPERKTLEIIARHLENSITEIKNLLPNDSVELYKSIENLLFDMTNEKNRINYTLKYYDVPINELNLQKRTYNCLIKIRAKNIGKLVQYSEEDLLSLKNGFGKKSLRDLKLALNKYHLDLRNPSYKIKQTLQS